MADILIRMDMPDSCFHCFAVIELRNDHDELTTYCSLTKPDSPAEWYKVIDGINHQQERMWFCPLHELPEHGDLIDRDEVYNRNHNCMDEEIIVPLRRTTCREMLDNMPVTVPASEEVADGMART